jgi:hypothetical protein
MRPRSPGWQSGGLSWRRNGWVVLARPLPAVTLPEGVGENSWR